MCKVIIYTILFIIFISGKVLSQEQDFVVPIKEIKDSTLLKTCSLIVNSNEFQLKKKVPRKIKAFFKDSLDIRFKYTNTGNYNKTNLENFAFTHRANRGDLKVVSIRKRIYFIYYNHMCLEEAHFHLIYFDFSDKNGIKFYIIQAYAFHDFNQYRKTLDCRSFKTIKFIEL